jgi:hypothetical protein
MRNLLDDVGGIIFIHNAFLSTIGTQNDNLLVAVYALFTKRFIQSSRYNDETSDRRLACATFRQIVRKGCDEFFFGGTFHHNQYQQNYNAPPHGALYR